ncbi:MAG: hypothetical protein KAG66_11620 [Methylococcales bacterium]|jgi:hypothetical protein|nr:hypothetical protein [Methylococcales bacterium]
MKWAYQILSNTSGVCPGIHQVRTKWFATERANQWASTKVDTRVLKQKKRDPSDVVKGWEIIAEINASS